MLLPTFGHIKFTCMPIWNRLWPHLLAYVIMIAAAFMLFKPYIFDGKVLAQPDNQRARAMQTEMMAYDAIDGKTPLWTNSMFSGMPVYMIRHTARGSLDFVLLQACLWWQDITFPHFVILLAMFMAYLALVIMGIDWRIALIGGISYGISTYYVDLAEAGHSTKMLAIAFTPGIWGAALLLLRQKWLLGTGLFTVLLSLQILSNHYQITYYTFLLLGIGLLLFGIQAFKQQQIKPFFIAVGLIALATTLSVASTISMLWPSYEYSKETIRGKSELKAKADKGSGLDKTYAFDWSYGVGESMTLLVPNFMGGGASQTFRGTETYKRIYPNMMSNFTQQGYPRDEAARASEQQVSALFYHGGQPFVGVAIYFGAALLFLFVLGAFVAAGPLRWWMFIAALFALTLAWGKHFFLNDLLFDYFPFFNKFRAVSMALGLSHLAVVLLAMLGLQAFFKGGDQTQKLKALYKATGIAAGLCVLALIAGSMMSMVGTNDEKVGEELAQLLRADRVSTLRADAFRSLIIILLTAGVLWSWVTHKMKLPLALLLVAMLTVGDVWLVDQRILFPEKYELAKSANNPPAPTEADQFIMDDPQIHFRVLDLRGNPFTNATTSFYHKSIGGYHAAKLSRYQDLIETYLSNPGENTSILGMLNTKYIIQDSGGKSVAIPMGEAMGNAWFVQKVRAVADADTELANLKKTTLRNECVIQASMMPDGWSATYEVDTAAFIRLDKYHPDTMTYTYSSKVENFAVFSEVYYPASKGWKVYLNGQPYEDFTKVNYLLRGLMVPAGENQTLQMVFHPESVYTGSTVAFAGSLIGILVLLGGLFLHFQKGGLGSAVLLQDEPIIKADPKLGLKRKKS